MKLLTVPEAVVKHNIEPQFVETLILSDKVERVSTPDGKSATPDAPVGRTMPDDSFSAKSLLAPCKQMLQTNISRAITLLETTVEVYKKAAELSDSQDRNIYIQAANEATVCIELCQEFKDIIATPDLRKEPVALFPHNSLSTSKSANKDNVPLSALNLPLSKYILHILRRNKIITQGDILQFIGIQGFEGLKTLKGLSAQSYIELEKALYEMEL